LALEFAVCDSYYASVPGPTEVNRMYVHSATSDGAGSNDDDHLAIGYPQQTIYDNLNAAGIEWASFYSDVPSPLVLRHMRQRENLARIHQMKKFKEMCDAGTLPAYSFLDPAYFSIPYVQRASDQHPSHDVGVCVCVCVRACVWVGSFSLVSFLLLNLLVSFCACPCVLSSLSLSLSLSLSAVFLFPCYHARSPWYALLRRPVYTSTHINTHSLSLSLSLSLSYVQVVDGEKLLKRTYEALRHSPLWNSSVLVVNYDEHGGFYDHMPTPLSVPNPDGKNSTDPPFDFTRIGVRVPAVFVSPWIEKGTVMHRPDGPTPTSEYEHSSVPATLKKFFGLPSFLTARDTWAGTFESVWQQRTTPRTDCPREIPVADCSPVFAHLSEEEFSSVPMSELQREFVVVAHALAEGEHLPFPPELEGLSEAEAGRYAVAATQKFFEENL
jgi:Phosphoesterase family